MTTIILLNSLFAVIAVGALVFVKRLAYVTAGGRFEAPAAVRRLREEREMLRRAA
jgi:hypothetical protein